MRPVARVLGATLATVACACSKSPNAEAASADSPGVAPSVERLAPTGAAADGDRRLLALPVAVEPARDGDLVLSVLATGQVRSDADAQLRSEVGGTVQAVLVRPGDRVQRGRPLVRLDPRPFDLAIREAEAALSEAEMRYYGEIAPDSMAGGRAPREARRRYALATSGVAIARVRLERARFERERAVLVAPFNGTVDRVDVAAGERVSPGEPVLTVVDLAHLRIEATVLEHDLPLIREGAQAVVTSAAAPDRPLLGRVAAVLPIVDSVARAGRAIVRVPGGAMLRPGMYADVRLEATRLTNRRLVHAQAVIERDGRPLVFVVKEGRAKWVYITPGRSNGTDTEVLPDSATGVIPIEPGDAVIVEGHLTLTHDAPVRPVAAQESQLPTRQGAGLGTNDFKLDPPEQRRIPNP